MLLVCRVCKWACARRGCFQSISRVFRGGQIRNTQALSNLMAYHAKHHMGIHTWREGIVHRVSSAIIGVSSVAIMVSIQPYTFDPIS